MGKQGFKSGFREFERDLNAAISPKVIFSKFRKTQDERKPGDVVRSLVKAARAGHGPNDEPYPGYSESYKQQIRRAGAGQKFFLVGIGRTARYAHKRGGMLDYAHFHWMSPTDRAIALRWSTTDDQMGAYAVAHNEGTATAGRSHNVKIPARPWMHFEASQTWAAVEQWLKVAMDRVAAELSAGRTPR